MSTSHKHGTNMDNNSSAKAKSPNSDKAEQLDFQMIQSIRKFFSEDQNIESSDSRFTGGHSPMITSTHIINSARQSKVIARDRKRSIDDNEKTPLNGSYRNRSLSWGSEAGNKLYSGQTGPIIAGGIYSSIDIPIQFEAIKDKVFSPLAKKKPFEDDANSFASSVVYGMINTAVVLPVIMSFGSIIYHDPFFRPYLPVLVKLTTISGIVHQLMFSTFSSLPFAVGQVQDAGLIFLSAIASAIVTYCKERGYDDESILATCTIGLSLSTAILGFALVIIGKLELVSAVQKLPTSVVGGYLAFIGFFCGQSGLSLMSNVSVSGFLEWYKFLQVEAFTLILPGVFGGLVIYFMCRYIKHAAVLPACITSIVLLFYSCLNLTGTTLSQARDEGWINKADPPPVWYHSWDYLKFDKVVWSALPSQSFTVISMIFVVALSSSLDVAAIELDLGSPLDYNKEINTVGMANMVSGMTGGYTGSYIFSQTIFSMRSGIRSRWCGYVIAINEFITIALPFSILAYLPNFFFGSLLIMICADLLWEWLWDVREKVTRAEYVVAWGTFILIQILGVEYGIVAGVLMFVGMKKAGFNMGDEDSEEERDSLMTCHMDSQGGSLGNFFTAFKSQLSLAVSHLSLSSMLGGSNQSSTTQDDKIGHIVETHESLMV